MNRQELNRLIAERRQQQKRQPSMAEKIKKERRDYARLNSKLGIKTPHGPSKNAKQMTEKEKEALKI